MDRRLLFFSFVFLFVCSLAKADKIPLSKLPKSLNPGGPVLISALSAGNLGYVAYANTIAQIIKDKYPDHPVRIHINYLNPHDKKLIETSFTFPEKTEVEIVRPGEKDDKITRWAEESSLIIAAAALGAINNVSFDCLIVAQVNYKTEPKQGCSARISTGLAPQNAGILAKPAVLKKQKTYSQLGFYGDFQKLLESSPELKTLLSRTVTGGFSLPDYHYYMAYMHQTEHFAEYFAIVSYLEAENSPWIFSNIRPHQLEDPAFKISMINAGIHHISFYDLKENTTEEIVIGSGSQRRINVVRLPQIDDDDAYTSLFALAQMPLGVTGNQSLFLAISLEKIPFYAVNTAKQIHINELMATFDSSGLLADFFQNTYAPKQKAEVIRLHRSQALAWAQQILGKKLANNLLLKVVDHYIRQ